MSEQPLITERKRLLDMLGLPYDKYLKTGRPERVTLTKYQISVVNSLKEKGGYIYGGTHNAVVDGQKYTKKINAKTLDVLYYKEILIYDLENGLLWGRPTLKILSPDIDAIEIIEYPSQSYTDTDRVKLTKKQYRIIDLLNEGWVLEKVGKSYFLRHSELVSNKYGLIYIEDKSFQPLMKNGWVKPTSQNNKDGHQEWIGSSKIPLITKNTL